MRRSVKEDRENMDMMMRGIARNRYASSNVLGRMTEHSLSDSYITISPASGTVRAIVENPNTPARALGAIAKADKVAASDKLLIAKNPNTDDATLRYLMGYSTPAGNEEEGMVRAAAAANWRSRHP